VILAGPRGRPATTCFGGRATLDDLFKRAVARRPDTLALIDPPDRECILGGEPRQLTYRGADRVISAVAGRLRRMGLRTDAIVAVQMASTVENVLTILGILRAGLIAMPLPILWRRADMVAALGRVGAMALIVSGRIGSADHYELAMGAAAEVFPIRHVCGYGNNPPDGLVAFDDLFTTDQLDPLPGWDEERAEPGPGAHLAVITWDMSGEGPVPVARSHAELIAAGLAVASESGLRENATLLSTMTLCSLAGIATCLVPWLLVGGTLGAPPPLRCGYVLPSTGNNQDRYGCRPRPDRGAARAIEPGSARRCRSRRRSGVAGP
jgi:acyl-CoA synthetase (AMP-forming)/AMP-acid ligase II